MMLSLLSTSLPLGLSGAAGSNAGRAEEFDSVGETKGVLKSAHYTASWCGLDQQNLELSGDFISCTLPVVLARASNGGAEGSGETSLPDMLAGVAQFKRGILQ